MAKVLENTQGLNIALMNEVAIICNKLNVDTKDVIAKLSFYLLHYLVCLLNGIIYHYYALIIHTWVI